MRNEADSGNLLLGIGLQRGVDIALLVHLYVAKPFVLKLFPQVFGKNQLLLGTRHAIAVLSRLRIEFGIVQEPFNNVHLNVLQFSLRKVSAKVIKNSDTRKEYPNYFVLPSFFCTFAA